MPLSVNVLNTIDAISLTDIGALCALQGAVLRTPDVSLYHCLFRDHEGILPNSAGWLRQCFTNTMPPKKDSERAFLIFITSSETTVLGFLTEQTSTVSLIGLNNQMLHMYGMILGRHGGPPHTGLKPVNVDDLS